MLQCDELRRTTRVDDVRTEEVLKVPYPASLEDIAEWLDGRRSTMTRQEAAALLTRVSLLAWEMAAALHGGVPAAHENEAGPTGD